MGHMAYWCGGIAAGRVGSGDVEGEGAFAGEDGALEEDGGAGDAAGGGLGEGAAIGRVEVEQEVGGESFGEGEGDAPLMGVGLGDPADFAEAGGAALDGDALAGAEPLAGGGFLQVAERQVAFLVAEEPAEGEVGLEDGVDDGGPPVLVAFAGVAAGDEGVLGGSSGSRSPRRRRRGRTWSRGRGGSRPGGCGRRGCRAP